MKNGRMISSRMKFFQRPAWNAVKYASGNAMIRHSRVEMPAYTIERPNCTLYSEIASQ